MHGEDKYKKNVAVTKCTIWNIVYVNSLYDMHNMKLLLFYVHKNSQYRISRQNQMPEVHRSFIYS